MAKFKVLGGDFKKGRGRFTFRNFSLPSFNLKAYFETVSLKDVELISLATPEMLELLIDDQQELGEIQNDTSQILFIARLKDKRHFIGQTDKNTYYNVLKSRKEMINSASTRQALAS